MNRLALGMALLLAAACTSDVPSAGDEPNANANTNTDDGTRDAASITPDASGSGIAVHAAFDLPRTVDTRTLSAITTDGSVYYALPDRSPRLVTLTPNATHDSFEVGTGPDLQSPSSEWDGEGVARASDGSFYVVTIETEPAVVHFDASGAQIEAVEVPAHYADQPINNKGLESLSLAPSGTYLFSCNETALTQDGVPPSKTEGAVVRILRLELATAAAAEYAYRTEPLGAGSDGDMGVSEVLALSDERLLVLERGYQSGYGNTIRIFEVDLAGATDVVAREPLGPDAPVVTKKLLVDVGELPAGAVTHPSTQPNPLLDNYEGLTLGPVLPDGRRALMLLSDDNGQRSQVARALVLAVPGL